MIELEGISSLLIVNQVGCTVLALGEVLGKEEGLFSQQLL